MYNLIAARISESPQERITFAEYMDLVLYHPQHGYYASGTVNIGSQGDFFTSPHLCADFGELLAEQFAEMWHILGRPERFTLVEMGAGQGLLAADVLGQLQKHHPELFSTLEYIIIEKAPGLIAQQQQQLQCFVGASVSWRTWEEIPEASIVGCCFSNELVDALPVHQILIESDKLCEIYVATPDNDESAIVEITGELSTPQLAEYFALVDIDLTAGTYPEGYRTEVNLAALDWLGAVANRLERGYLLTIDYGYPATRYYSPTRTQGTLQCYYRHSRHANPYINVGHQDITAHVDFTALERHGESRGLHKLGFTQQALFLMALGLGDRIAALSTSTQDIQQVLRRRDALHQLMDPLGLGGFGVLVQSKGLTEEEKARSLKGFRMPSAF